MSEWREVIFSELCDITRGASPRPIHDFLGKEGMPWIKIADATSLDSRFIEKTNECIKLHGVKASVRVFPGDLILSNSATPGLPKFVSIEACIHDGWMLLRNFRGLDKHYAYWLLLNERKNLVAQGNGSVFTNLKTDILKSHRVKIPDTGTQKTIASFLDEISTKIELNRQMNETLETTARLFFKDWFVDYGPTRAKAEGRPPYLAPELWSLFPNALDDDDKPIGWEEKPLSAVIESIGGGTPKTSVAEYWNGSIPWFSVVDAPTPSDVFVIKTEKTITTSGLENSSTRLIPRNATIITARGTVGKLALVGIEMAMNQSCYAMTGRAGWPNYFTHFLLKTAVQTLQANAHGSVFDTITRATFETVSAYCPTQNIAVAFDQTICDLMEQIRSNLFENNTLSQLRDLLLPKLMSGEMRLREAERMVEQAARENHFS